MWRNRVRSALYFNVFQQRILLTTLFCVTLGKILEHVVAAAMDKGHIVRPLYQNKESQKDIILNNKQQDFDAQKRSLKHCSVDIKEWAYEIKLTDEEQRKYDATDANQKIMYGWMMAPTRLTNRLIGKLRSVYSVDACHAKTELGGIFFFCVLRTQMTI